MILTMPIDERLELVELILQEILNKLDKQTASPNIPEKTITPPASKTRRQLWETIHTDKQVTFSEIAIKLGVDPSTLSRWFTHTSRKSRKLTLRKIWDTYLKLKEGAA